MSSVNTIATSWQTRDESATLSQSIDSEMPRGDVPFTHLVRGKDDLEYHVLYDPLN